MSGEKVYLLVPEPVLTTGRLAARKGDEAHADDEHRPRSRFRSGRHGGQRSGEEQIVEFGISGKGFGDQSSIELTVTSGHVGVGASTLPTNVPPNVRWWPGKN